MWAKDGTGTGSFLLRSHDSPVPDPASFPCCLYYKKKAVPLAELTCKHECSIVSPVSCVLSFPLSVVFNNLLPAH